MFSWSSCCNFEWRCIGCFVFFFLFIGPVASFAFWLLCDLFKVQLHSNRFGTVGRSTSRGSTAPQKSNYSTGKERGEQVQLTGKNTFARPRSLKPLGWDANKPRTNEAEDEKPKSNDEFRQLFLKKWFSECPGSDSFTTSFSTDYHLTMSDSVLLIHILQITFSIGG